MVHNRINFSQICKIVAKGLKGENHQQGIKSRKKQLAIEIEQAITASKYDLVIELLDELKDLQRNIRHYRDSQHQYDRFDVVVRYVDDNVIDPEQIPTADLLQLGLNDLRAVLELLHNENNCSDALKARLTDLARACWLAMQHVETKDGTSEQRKLELKKFRSALVTLFCRQQELTVKQAKQKIGVAKNFVNLRNPSYHVVTANQMNFTLGFFAGKNNYWHVTADVALCDLTEEQQAEFAGRKFNYRAMWYKNLAKNKWIQRLVDSHVDYIMQENRVIPTQLRKFIPLLRNSFHQQTGVVTFSEDYDTMTNKKIADLYHSGALPFLSNDKKENTRISSQNKRQLRQRVGGDCAMLSLNDKNPLHLDGKVVSITEEEMREEGYSHSNVSLNPIIKFVSFKEEMIEEQLLAAIDHINTLEFSDEKNKKELINYLTQQTEIENKDQAFMSVSEALQALKKNELVLPSDAMLFQLVIASRYFISIKNRYDDPLCRYLLISAFSMLINSLLRDKNVDVKTLNVFCLSGKDRTGEVLIAAAIIGMMFQMTSKLGFESLSSRERVDLTSLVRKLGLGSHQQYIASSFGNTIGAWGLQAGLRSLPLFWPGLDQLLHKETASLHKKMPLFSAEQMPHYMPCLITQFSLSEAVRQQIDYINMMKKNKKSVSKVFYHQGIAIRRINLLQKFTDKITQTEEITLEQLQVSLKELIDQNQRLTQNTWYHKGTTHDFLNALADRLAEHATEVGGAYAFATSDSTPSAAETMPFS